MSYACCNMLNQMFDRYDCRHTIPSLHREIDGGAVLVFHGQNSSIDGIGSDAAKVFSNFVAPLPWVIFVSVGDESTDFPYRLLSHPNSKLWVQTPLPTTKADRYLIEGYPANTNRPNIYQDLDFFFAGQSTHDRRQSCAVALRAVTMEGRLQGSALFTDSFGAGYSQQEYLKLMSRARIVPCPSGPASPDTFRIWEALECGAVPIVDARSLRDETVGFWNTVLPGAPLRFIYDWSSLPEEIEYILGDYERVSRICQHWWKSYKLRFGNWLAEDMISLGAK